MREIEKGKAKEIETTIKRIVEFVSDILLRVEKVSRQIDEIIDIEEKNMLFLMITRAGIEPGTGLRHIILYS